MKEVNNIFLHCELEKVAVVYNHPIDLQGWLSQKEKTSMQLSLTSWVHIFRCDFARTLEMFRTQRGRYWKITIDSYSSLSPTPHPVVHHALSFYKPSFTPICIMLGFQNLQQGFISLMLDWLSPDNLVGSSLLTGQQAGCFQESTL